jgi:rhamnose transport system permease protein
MTDPTRATTSADAAVGAQDGTARVARAPWWTRLAVLARWEVLLLVILGVFIWYGTRVSPYFLTGGNFANLVSAGMEVAVMALPSTLIIITGEIDLSVESTLGLASAILGFLWAAGVPLPVDILIVLLIGALAGALNGVLVARAGLPSLVVTLGTLALFRGLAQVTLGTRAISDFPAAFTSFGFDSIPGTSIPWTLLVFVVLGAIFWFVAHGTWIGRQIFAAGKNKDAARYSGVDVAKLKLALFVVCGVISALAGVMLTARFSSARADNGTGLVLTVVTIVLLGGVDINGGKGTIPGVIIAVFTLATLQNVLNLAGVSGEYQAVAVGLLLIVSVTAPYIARQARSVVGRVRRARHPPPGSVAQGEVVG